MTDIRGLTIQDEKPNGKTYFEPAVLTVKGTSQYNDDQISFEEIEGFWQLPENFTGERKPPNGTVAKFNLSTNPKRGQNAKPGSMYMDIAGIYKTDEQPIEQPQGDPREEYNEYDADQDQPSAPVGLSTPAGMYRYDATHYYYVDKAEKTQEAIAKSQAWNGLTAMFNAGEGSVFNRMVGHLSKEKYDEFADDWSAGYEALKDGRVPFNEPPEPVKPEPEYESGMAPADDGYGEPEKMDW